MESTNAGGPTSQNVTFFLVCTCTHRPLGLVLLTAIWAYITMALEQEVQWNKIVMLQSRLDSATFPF